MRRGLLVLFLVGCLIGCAGQNLIYLHPDLRGKAEREVVLDLSGAAGKQLDLETSFGEISVRVAERAKPQVVAKLILRARTDEEAREALAGFDVTMEEKSDRVVVRREGKGYKLEGTDYRVAPRLELTATVRPGQRLMIHSGSGSIEVVGAVGDTDLSTGFGDIAVAGARGQRLKARTSSGKVRLQTVEVADIDLETSFGGTRLVEVHGNLRVRTGSGNVSLRDFVGDKCRLATNFGDIEARGTFRRLQAETASGDIDVFVAPKSRVDSAWRLESSFGDVEIALPAGLGCRIDASTSFGKIRNERKDGGTGNDIKLVTRSGNILVHATKAEDRPGTRAAPLIGRKRSVDPTNATFVEPIHRVFENRSFLIALENAGKDPVVSVGIQAPEGVKLSKVTSHTTPGAWNAKTATFVFTTPVPAGETFHVAATINRFAMGEATNLTYRVNY